MSSVSEILHQRISTRAFLDQPVTEAQVRDLLERARFSPSGGNLQPWHVVVVSGDARAAVIQTGQEALVASGFQGEPSEDPIYPSGLKEPYRSRRFEIGEDMYGILGIPREDKAGRMQWLARNFEFFGAPVGLFFFIDRTMGRGQWAHLGMFMQSIALVAEEMGLATCMQEAWAMVRPSLEAHFDMGEDLQLYCGMALGYPDKSAPVNSLRSKRADIDEFAQLRGF